MKLELSETSKFSTIPVSPIKQNRERCQKKQRESKRERVCVYVRVHVRVCTWE